MRYSFEDAKADEHPSDAVLRDARHPVDLPPGLEGSRPSRRDLGRRQLRVRCLGAVPRGRGPLRDARSRRSAPGEGAGARRHLVRARRPQQRVPARRPQRIESACSTRGRRCPALETSTPTTRTPPTSPRGSRPTSGIARSRSRREIEMTGCGGRRDRRPGQPVRRAVAVPEGRAPALRLQLPRDRGAAGRRRRTALTVGQHTVVAEFVEEEARTHRAVAQRRRSTLKVDGDEVARGEIRTQPGKFSLSGEGLAVGRGHRGSGEQGVPGGVQARRSHHRPRDDHARGRALRKRPARGPRDARRASRAQAE